MSFKPITKSKNGKWKGSGSGSKYAKFHGKGGWGQRKNVSLRKAVPAVVMLFLFLILSIGNYGGPIGFVMGDYNTSFSHTRTNIFTDTQFLGPTSSGGPITFNTKVNGSGSGTSLVLPAIGVSSGDTIVIDILGIGAFAGFTTTDSQGNTYTQRVLSLTGSGSGATTIIYTAPTLTTGADTITTTTGGFGRVWDEVALDYSGVTGFGNTATQQNDNCCDGTGSSSSSVTLTVSATTSSIQEAMFAEGFGISVITMSPSSGQTVRNDAGFGSPSRHMSTDRTGLTGSQTYTFTWTASPSVNCTGGSGPCFFSHSALELIGGSPLVSNFSKVRWNFNSTCVTLNGNVTFDYALGVSGKGGNNCNSADILISKASVNLQAASAKMLEMVSGLQTSANCGTRCSRLDIVLRATNGTLPSFTTNYEPFNDTNARFIWTVCFHVNDPICTFLNPSAFRQGIFIAHDETKTITQETFGNDLVISSSSSQCGASVSCETQAVLNFTGPNNYLNAQNVQLSFNNVSQNLASQFQFGESYYILVKASFATTIAPGQSSNVVWNSNQIGSIPRAFGIFSVPASCSDPVNKAACSTPTAQPTFDINPLDPRTWGNAIIKGLVWVFLTAIPGGLTIMVSGFLSVLQSSLNFIGNQVGWGNVGDNTFAFFNNVGSFILTSTPLGWIATLITESIQEVTAFGSWFGTWTGGLAVAIKDLIFAVPLIGNIVVKIFVFLPTSYILMDLLFWFYYCAEGGLSGMAHWFEWNKWMAFSTYGILEKFVNAFLSLISWLISKIPTLDGTSLPHLPSIEGGSVPSVRIDLGIPAIRKGDPFAVLGFIIGSVFSWLWITSASGPAGSSLYLGSVTKFSALNPLLFIFVSFAGLMMIPLLPAYIVKITTGTMETQTGKGAIF